MRLVAYRQYTWWVHGCLSHHNRIAIPACAVAKIRGGYPEHDPAAYKGFEAVVDGEAPSYPGKQKILRSNGKPPPLIIIAGKN